MKRIVTLTTTALLLAGLTSLGLAHENMTEGKQAPAAQNAPANTTPSVAQPTSSTLPDTQHATLSGKTRVRHRSHTAHKKVAQANQPMSEKKPISEKKETKPTASMTPSSHEQKAEPLPSAAPTGTTPTK
jgi:hypothetical protein